MATPEQIRLKEPQNAAGPVELGKIADEVRKLIGMRNEGLLKGQIFDDNKTKKPSIDKQQSAVFTQEEANKVEAAILTGKKPENVTFAQLLVMAHRRELTHRYRLLGDPQLSDPLQTYKAKNILTLMTDLDKRRSILEYEDGLIRDFLDTIKSYREFWEKEPNKELRKKIPKEKLDAIEAQERKVEAMLSELKAHLPLLSAIGQARFLENVLREDAIATTLKAVLPADKKRTVADILKANPQHPLMIVPEPARHFTIEQLLGAGGNPAEPQFRTIEEQLRVHPGNPLAELKRGGDPRVAIELRLREAKGMVGHYSKEAAQIMPEHQVWEEKAQRALLAANLPEKTTKNNKEVLTTSLTIAEVKTSYPTNAAFAEFAATLPPEKLGQKLWTVKADLESLAGIRAGIPPNASDADMQKYADKVEKRVRDMFRVGEKWESPLNKNTRESRVANSMYVDSLLAASDVLFEDMFTSGNLSALPTLHANYKEVVKVEMANMQEELTLGGDLLALLVTLRHIGPETRLQGSTDPLAAAKKAILESRALPDALKQEIEQEWEVYATGFDAFVDAIEEACKKHDTRVHEAKERFQTKLKKYTDKIGNVVAVANKVAWFIPRNTLPIDGFNLQALAGKLIGDTYVVDTSKLETELGTWQREIDTLHQVVERFEVNSREPKQNIRTDIRLLRELRTSVPPQELALAEVPHYDVGFAFMPKEVREKYDAIQVRLHRTDPADEVGSNKIVGERQALLQAEFFGKEKVFGKGGHDVAVEWLPEDLKKRFLDAQKAVRDATPENKAEVEKILRGVQREIIERYVREAIRKYLSTKGALEQALKGGKEKENDAFRLAAILDSDASAVIGAYGFLLELLQDQDINALHGEVAKLLDELSEKVLQHAYEFHKYDNLGNMLISIPIGVGVTYLEVKVAGRLLGKNLGKPLRGVAWGIERPFVGGYRGARYGYRKLIGDPALAKAAGLPGARDVKFGSMTPEGRAAAAKALIGDKLNLPGGRTFASVIDEVHVFRLAELEGHYARLDAAKAELDALEKSPTKNPKAIADAKQKIYDINNDIRKIVLEKRDMLKARGLPHADANKLVRSGICGLDTMDDVLKQMAKVGIVADDILDDMVKLIGVQKLRAGASVTEIVDDLAKSGHLTPEAAAKIKGSPSAQKLFRGALEIEDDAMRAAETARLVKTANRVTPMMRTMAGVGAAMEVFGVAMAVMEYQEIEKKKEQTKNPELLSLYNGMQTRAVIQGGVSATLFIINGYGLLVGSASVIAFSAAMLPVALALAGAVYVAGKFDEVSEGWLRNEDDYETWPEELLMKEICERDNQSFWAQLGLVLGESDFGVDAWFTSDEKAAEIAEKIQSANAQTAVKVLRAYMRKMTAFALPKNESEDARAYKLRQDIFVADAVMYLARYSVETRVTGEDLDRAKQHALLCARSREMKKAGISQKISWKGAKGEKVTFDLADYAGNTKVYHNPKEKNPNGRLSAGVVLSEFIRSEYAEFAGVLDEMRTSYDPNMKALFHKTTQMYILGQLKPYIDRYAGRAHALHDNEADLEMLRSGMSEMIRHRMFWEVSKLESKKQPLTGKDLEDTIGSLRGLLTPKQGEEGQFYELLKHAQGSSLIGYDRLDKRYKNWLQEQGAPPDMIQKDKNKSYLLNPQFLSQNLITQSSQDNTVDFAMVYMPEAVSATPFNGLREKESAAKKILDQLEPRFVPEARNGANLISFAYYEDYRYLKTFGDRLRLSLSDVSWSREQEEELVKMIDGLSKYDWSRAYYINQNHIGERTNAAKAVMIKLNRYRRALNDNYRQFNPIDVTKESVKRVNSGYEKYVTCSPKLGVYVIKGNSASAELVVLDPSVMQASPDGASWEKTLPGIGKIRATKSPYEGEFYWKCEAVPTEKDTRIVFTARKTLSKGAEVDITADGYTFELPKEKSFNVPKEATTFSLRMQEFEVGDYQRPNLKIKVTQPDGTILTGRFKALQEGNKWVPFFIVEERQEVGKPAQQLESKQGITYGMEVLSAWYYNNPEKNNSTFVRIVPGPAYTGSTFEFSDDGNQKQTFTTEKNAIAAQKLNFKVDTLAAFSLARADIKGDLKIEDWRALEGVQTDIVLEDGRTIRGVFHMRVTTSKDDPKKLSVEYSLRTVRVREANETEFKHIYSSSLKSLGLTPAMTAQLVTAGPQKIPAIRFEMADLGSPVKNVIFNHPAQNRVISVLDVPLTKPK